MRHLLNVNTSMFMEHCIVMSNLSLVLLCTSSGITKALPRPVMVLPMVLELLSANAALAEPPRGIASVLMLRLPTMVRPTMPVLDLHRNETGDSRWPKQRYGKKVSEIGVVQKSDQAN